MIGEVLQRRPRARRGGPASGCSRRSCGRRAARSRRCGRTRRSSRTSQPHQRIVLFGKVEIWGSRGLQITDPEFEIVRTGSDGDGTGEPLHTGRIVPVYERTGSVTPNMQRRFVLAGARAAAGRRASIRVPRRHPARASAGRRGAPRSWQAHFPAARRRTSTTLNAFRDAGAAAADLRGLLRLPDRPRAAPPRERAGAQAARVARWTIAFAQSARAVLPFKLTRRAARRARARSSTTCSSRGRCSGCCRATSAPARRSSRCWPRSWRWRTASRWRSWRRPRSSPSSTTARIARLLDGRRAFASALLTGRVTAATRRDLLPAHRARRRSHLVVGTHALVQEHVKFKALALAVIDEQHRFGVVQRGDAARRRACIPTCW